MNVKHKIKTNGKNSYSIKTEQKFQKQLQRKQTGLLLRKSETDLQPGPD